MEEEKRVVLVTGGSRGIGASIIEYFAKNNYDVVIDYVTEVELADFSQKVIDTFSSSDEEANALKVKCEEYGARALAIRADVSNEEQVKTLIELTMEEFGRIDVLVNNAAIVIDKDFSDRTFRDFEETLRVNVSGAFLVSKYVAKHMMAAKRGKIINASSTNGLNTMYPTSIDYDASKAAIISLTQNMAIEFAPYINVNATAAGWANTEMNTQLPQEFLEEEKKKILLHRFAKPEEIAKLVYFLASDDADYITGETIRIDGGIFLV